MSKTNSTVRGKPEKSYPEFPLIYRCKKTRDKTQLMARANRRTSHTRPS
jgi:hypothetical protein